MSASRVTSLVLTVCFRAQTGHGVRFAERRLMLVQSKAIPVNRLDAGLTQIGPWDLRLPIP